MANFKKAIPEQVDPTTYKLKHKALDIPINDVIATIGGDTNKFKPHVKIEKWNGEVSLELELETTKNLQPVVEGGKIKWKDNDKEVHYYSVEPRVVDIDRWFGPVKQLEGGGLEVEVELKKKPKTNKVVFNITTKGLKFYYQPFLTLQEKIDMEIGRPENVEGSYAVYREDDTSAHASESLADKYKSGKIAHIYRPEIIDANGNKIWGELNINEATGKLTVTIPQDFLDTAVYPVRVDPTFGYTVAGSSSIDRGGYVVGSLFTMGGTAGTGDSITVSLGDYDGGAVGCIYLHSDLSLLTNSVTAEDNSQPQSQTWVTMNFSTGPTLAASTAYVIAIRVEGGGKGNNWDIWYDSGTSNQGHTDFSPAGLYPNPPDTMDPTGSHTTNKYSIYCTYTEEGAPAPSFIPHMMIY